jgi:hypothetical protein
MHSANAGEKSVTVGLQLLQTNLKFLKYETLKSFKLTWKTVQSRSITWYNVVPECGNDFSHKTSHSVHGKEE